MRTQVSRSVVSSSSTLRASSGASIASFTLFASTDFPSSQINVNDLPVGRSVEEAVRLVKAFQFTDEYGEVCPANWHEGGKTIKPTPTDKLEYFSTAEADASKKQRTA